MIATTFVSLALVAGFVQGAAIDKRATKPDSYYVAQAQAGVGALPSGWTAKGCYSDSIFSRSLSADSTASLFGMTYQVCTSYCSSRGYAYAGVERGYQCFCGNGVSRSARLVDYIYCDGIACSGNWGQDCGGWANINVFYKAPAASTTPVPSASASASASTSSNHSSSSSLSSSSSSSTSSSAPTSSTSSSTSLTSSTSSTSSAPSTSSTSSTASTSDNSSTSIASSTSSTAPDASTSASSSSPSSTAASTSSTSSTSSPPSASIASSAASFSSASSTSTESAAPIPSGPIFPSGWSSSNVCIAEVGGRALTGSHTAGSDMTQEKCASFCAAGGYTLAGLEYSSECWCGNLLANGASLLKTSSACTMKCAGDSASICGGGNALSLLVSQAAVTTLVSDLTHKAVVLPSGWSVASTSCVAEGTSGRALASASTASDSMTIETCLNFCQDKGFQYAGIEYGRECYCGDSLVNGASLDIASSSCNTACAGDDSSLCGGGNALQLYNNPSLALNLITSNAFSYQGCIIEVSGRALTGDSLAGDDMTAEVCTAFCASEGFKYAGLEYGRECYCGNSFSNGASASGLSTQCSMPCAGSGSGVCGGPNAISLYANPVI
ncbi:hypothetical protein IAU59_006912 [Kwoniella sp. CBS 9459]